MKIYKYIEYEYNGTIYVKTLEISYDYNGPIELACGATAAQNNLENSQASFAQQAQQQASAEFGNASTVFNNLMSTLSPTVAAGPNQQGFSPTEASNLNSQAITQTGQSYKNAKQALGEGQSANGGGNTPLPSGAEIGENTQLASSAANQTASELGQITEQNYATGRQNYNTALAGMESAPGVFGAATGATGAATGASSAASNTANQIAQENQSWIQPVAGALGGVAGAAVGDFKQGSGSSSSPAPMLDTTGGADPLGLNYNPTGMPSPLSSVGGGLNYPTSTGM